MARLFRPGPDHEDAFRGLVGLAVGRGVVVGEAGFEPAASCSQSRCAARLRYSPDGTNRSFGLILRTKQYRNPKSCLLGFGTLRVEHKVDDSAYCTADERRDDEEPNLAQCRSTHDQCGSEAPSRVHRCPRDRDSHEVDKGERQPDYQARSGGMQHPCSLPPESRIRRAPSGSPRQ